MSKSKPKKQVSLDDKEINTIRAMITYMLTEDDVDKIEDKFVNKLFKLEEKFDKLATC